jgi:hypothetical protein
MFFQERKRIAQLAASARLSAVYGVREHVDAGGLSPILANVRFAPEAAIQAIKLATHRPVPAGWIVVSRAK